MATNARVALARLLLQLVAASAVAATLLHPENGRSAEGSASTDAFPSVGGNLTRVDWAHAVNDRAFLEAVLASEVMMIEADIVLGHVLGAEDSPPLPVMAHPPAALSDLSLAAFLAAVAAHNGALSDPAARKGVKLDFKSIEALAASQDTLAPLAGDDVAYPVWLNADILPGPVDSVVQPVDAARFLQLSALLPRAVLSVGWTTRYGPGEGVEEGSYAPAHTAAMLRALDDGRVVQRAQQVTFPVRAGLAAAPASGDVLRALLRDTAHLRSTLTVWSSAGDPVDLPALRDFMLSVGLDRTFLDVPDEVSEGLHLPPPDTVSAVASVATA